MRTGTIRRLAVLGVAALVAFAAARLFLGEGRTDASLPIAEIVDRGEIAATVTATGIVNPVTTVQVGTYVSGPILALDVDFNSPVKKGQRVAKIDPAPFQMKVDAMEASLANARARVRKSESDLDLKRRQLARQEQLRAKETVSENDYDTARSATDQAVAQVALDQAGVKQAEAALREARINLAYTDIVSPVDGVVVSRNVDVGQTVAASFQTPTLFLIARDLAEMQVNASVSESDIGSVHEGQPATFGVDAYPGRTFEGRIVQVRNSPVAVQNVVTYPVVIGVDNADLALKPGMTATVTVRTDERADALRVPLRALRFTPPAEAPGGGNGAVAAANAAPSPRPGPAAPSAVWRLGTDGAMERIEVRTGLRDERFAEVLEATLAPGDRVVVGLPRPAAEEPAANPFAPARRR